MRATVEPSAGSEAARRTGPGTELRPANDPVPRLGLSSAPVAVTRFGFLCPRRTGIKFGQPPARRYRTAVRPLPGRRIPPVAGVVTARERIPRHTGQHAEA